MESVRAARDRHLAANGFTLASYNDRWARIKVGPIPLVFPNTASRRRAIPLHDLHHVATGYATTLIGEAEISAWELGGGCANYWAAWLLDAVGTAVGLVIAPRRVIRAFRRGRRSRNLYQDGWDEAVLDLTVDELRARVLKPRL